MDQNRICVGAFSGAFGVHGEVRLKSFCTTAKDIADYRPLTSESGDLSFNISIVSSIKNGFSVKVEGVSTKEQAEKLAGVRLFTPRAILPSLPDDEFYHTDLIGLVAVDTGGAVLGKVTLVENYGAGDFLEITGPGLKNPALLPFTREAVPTVDLKTGRIIVDAPDGVFPE